jgi:predicted outer membrane protein
MLLPFTTAESEPQEVLHTAKELHAAKEKTNRKLRTFLETKKSLPAGASEG